MPILDSEVPRARMPLLQHVLDTYASEINKAASVWQAFADRDLEYRPHPRSATVGDIFRHELLSGRRFFGEFLGAEEPPANAVLPAEPTVAAFVARVEELARPRLTFLADRDEPWWLERVPFFGVDRARIWIVWRRILHTAHHRTQLTVYLRLLDRPVPSVYGPTADVTWTGADPTQSLDAAGRK
ncbi:MAG: DinB family protein [Betaproteobacteria bacterium]